MGKTGLLGVKISDIDRGVEDMGGSARTDSSASLPNAGLDETTEEMIHTAVLQEQLKALGIRTPDIADAMRQVRERIMGRAASR